MQQLETAKGIIEREYAKVLKPYFLSLELTYRCNLRCLHCYIPPHERTNRNELSLDEIKDILSQAKKLGFIFVMFTGGELFARKDIFDILEYAYKKKFIIYLKTNGVSITEEIAKKLAGLKIQRIDISVYGFDRETYKTVTGNGAAFRKVIRAILYLKKCGIEIHLVYIILKNNISSLSRLDEFQKKNDLKFEFNFDIFSMINGCRAPFKYACLDREELLNISRIFIKFKKKPKKEKNKEISGPVCGVCSGLAISPFGDVFPCLIMRKRLGNIRSQTLKDIWYESKELKEIRALNDVKNLKGCLKCPLKNDCRGRNCLESAINCGPHIKKYAEIAKYIHSRMSIPGAKQCLLK